LIGEMKYVDELKPKLIIWNYDDWDNNDSSE
jgi:hypothetical protein